MKFIETDGFEFIEFCSSDHDAVAEVFSQLGFQHVGQHKHKNVELYRQNDVNFILNCEAWSHAAEYENLHGPSSNAIAFRVKNIADALQTASELRLDVVHAPVGPMELNIPAIRGVGGSLIYLVDRYGDHSIYDVDFDLNTRAFHESHGLIQAVDHVTQNVHAGKLDSVVDEYKRIFGFQELQHFDIQGKYTGLKSTALMSSCGKIRIPINEPVDEQSQIEEFLRLHRGEGVQHIALETYDILAAVLACNERGLSFQTTPDSYYDGISKRIDKHDENIDALKRRGVLIDGSEMNGILLQIFTKNAIGPMFFELIQRKGNSGFGEGNFQALFESIEHEQEMQGVFDDSH